MKSNRPLTKTTLNLYEGQWDDLGRLHPDTDTGKVIRDILAIYIERLRGKTQQPAIELPEIKL